MPVELGVIRADDDGRGAALEALGQVIHLLDAVEEEVAGVLIGLAARGVPVVGLLVRERDLAGDAVILDADVLALAGGLDIRADVIDIAVISDVSIELAIARVA